MPWPLSERIEPAQTAFVVPYYQDAFATIYHADCRGLLAARRIICDAVVTDPPYGDTSLSWEDIDCGAHSVATRGIIDINGASCADVSIDGLDMVGITAALGTNYGVYVHAAVTGKVTLENLRFKDLTCAAFSAGRSVRLDGIDMTRITFDPAMLPGPGSVVRNVSADTRKGRVIYVDGVDVDIDGVDIVDFGVTVAVHAIAFEAGGDDSILKDVTIRQRTSIPAGASAIRYNGTVPKILRNVTAKSAGTDFTSANTVTFLSGTAGSYISDLRPDPFRATLVWDPVSLGTGQVGGTTVSITGARIGDALFIAPGIDIGNMTASGLVSANDTMRINLYNSTAGTIDIASSTWVVWVEKR